MRIGTQKSGRRNFISQSSYLPALALAIVLGIACRSFAVEPAAAVNAPNGLPWVQTFSNDFTSANAQSYLNQWTKQTGDGTAYGLPAGWGNNEQEIYTTSNVAVSGAGLTITATIPTGTINSKTNPITSARITSQNYFSQTYGLFQWTASIPSGGGLWPALWMLPSQSNGYGNGWPTSGEIDVFESGGSGLTANKQEQGSFHTGPSFDISQTAVYGPSGYDTRNSNTYDLLWLPVSTTNPHGLLQWYVNGTLYETRTGSNSGTNNTGWYNPGGGTNAAPFDKPFYFLMNMAIGGNYPGGQIPAAGSYGMTISDVEAFQLPILGDVNRDGHLNVKDLTAMENALADPTDFAAADGITTAQLSLIGDVNGDGKFNNADLQALITTLKAGGGSDGAVPEPSAFLLLAFGLCALIVWRQKMIGRLACHIKQRFHYREINPNRGHILIR